METLSGKKEMVNHNKVGFLKGLGTGGGASLRE